MRLLELDVCLIHASELINRFSSVCRSWQMPCWIQPRGGRQVGCTVIGFWSCLFWALLELRGHRWNEAYSGAFLIDVWMSCFVCVCCCLFNFCSSCILAQDVRSGRWQEMAHWPSSLMGPCCGNPVSSHLFLNCTVLRDLWFQCEKLYC